MNNSRNCSIQKFEELQPPVTYQSFQAPLPQDPIRSEPFVYDPSDKDLDEELKEAIKVSTGKRHQPDGVVSVSKMIILVDGIYEQNLVLLKQVDNDDTEFRYSSDNSDDDSKDGLRIIEPNEPIKGYFRPNGGFEFTSGTGILIILIESRTDY